jgi:hypothetical protein
MSVLLRSESTATDKATIGYYGPFIWLNGQALFDRVFERVPTMLPFSPLSKILSGENLDKFINKRKFDIFIDSCRGYFIGMTVRRQMLRLPTKRVN